MTHSESINEIATALAKAQAEMRNPGTAGVNAFAKYKYATAPDYLDMIRGPLTKHNIAFTMDVADEALTFLLVHTSGQWLRYTMPIRLNPESSKSNNPDQAWGSHLTYCKKYLLMLVFGIHGDEDDDGQSSQTKTEPAPQQGPKPYLKKNYDRVTSEQIQNIMFEIGEHTDIAQSLLKNFGIEKLSELPKDYYLKIIAKIRENVAARKK